jgi:hypothetical protein
VTPARLAARLVGIEASVARLRPRELGAPFAWLRWSTLDELLDLERLSEAVHHGHELTAAEQLRAVECEVAATRRMLAGEKPA